MKKIKYSVIIPYYNAKDTIDNLLISIPDRSDIEILIVNDKSESIDRNIENKFANISLLDNNTDYKGAGVCRNIALDIAKGDFVLFADADDIFCDNAFSIFDKYSKENKDVIYFSPTSRFKHSNARSYRHLSYKILVDNYIENNSDLIRYKFYVPWSKLIKKDLIDEYNIRFEEIMASNDINFSLRVGYFSKDIMASNEVVYCVIESNDSLTKNLNENILDTRFFAMCRYNDFLKSVGLKKKQNPMTFHLKNALHLSISKFFSRFFYCLNKKYPVFHSFSSLQLLMKKYFIIYKEK